MYSNTNTNFGFVTPSAWKSCRYELTEKEKEVISMLNDYAYTINSISKNLDIPLKQILHTIFVAIISVEEYDMAASIAKSAQKAYPLKYKRNQDYYSYVLFHKRAQYINMCNQFEKNKLDELNILRYSSRIKLLLIVDAFTHNDFSSCEEKLKYLDYELKKIRNFENKFKYI